MNRIIKIKKINTGLVLLAFVSAWLINFLTLPLIFSFLGSFHDLSFNLSNNTINILLQHPEDVHHDSKLNISENDHQIFLPISETQFHPPISHHIFENFVQLIHYDNFFVSDFQRVKINLKKARGPPYPDIKPSYLKLNHLKTIVLLI